MRNRDAIRGVTLSVLMSFVGLGNVFAVQTVDVEGDTIEAAQSDVSHGCTALLVVLRDRLGDNAPENAEGLNNKCQNLESRLSERHVGGFWYVPRTIWRNFRSSLDEFKVQTEELDRETMGPRLEGEEINMADVEAKLQIISMAIEDMEKIFDKAEAKKARRSSFRCDSDSQWDGFRAELRMRDCGVNLELRERACRLDRDVVRLAAGNACTTR
ncbi:MAG: hypothetical protein HYT79_00560 [Elusimicrobia bacterium]|nr:hypothetical protein [Elusimicrobiota bacterium]